MGCSANKEAPNRGSIGQPTSQFVALIRKLSIEFQMEADTLLVKGKQLRHELRQSISKPLNNRSRQGQYAQLQKLTFLHHFRLIYEHLNLQCRAIIERQALINQLLVTSGSLADFPVLRIPIEHILFSISIIHDGKLSVRNADLKKFQDVFAQPMHCIPEPKGVDFEWLQFYKHNLKPTAVMIKQMAFNFCQDETVDMKKFHQIGLLFKY